MRRRYPPRRLVVFAAAVALALMLGMPTATGAASATTPQRSGPSDSSRPASTQSEVSASEVTWNGVDTSAASSVSSAFTVTFNQAVNVAFAWNPNSTPGVTEARLAMLYFGFAVSTRDVSPIQGSGPSSSAAMNWTVGAIQYVVEGVFGLTASLLASNGTTLWSENFFVRLAAPYSILAALPLILILLGVYELYALLRSGRQSVLGRSKPPVDASPPPSGSAPGTGSSSTAPESGTSPPGGNS